MWKKRRDTEMEGCNGFHLVEVAGYMGLAGGWAGKTLRCYRGEGVGIGGQCE